MIDLLSDENMGSWQDAKYNGFLARSAKYGSWQDATCMGGKRSLHTLNLYLGAWMAF